MNDTRPDSKSAGVTFLHWLYGDDAPGWLTIWTLPDKATAWFPGHDLSSAATYAQDRATTHDVYFGVCLRQRQLHQGQRGTASDVQAVPGLYLDIDLKDDHAHKKIHLPETVTQVYDLLQHTILARPTFLIHSGYGLHMYWLFREPYVIEDSAARQWIAQLNQRLQTAFQAAAKVHGWTIDSTFDLARVLRLPGTINHKRPEALRPVEVLEADEDCRYNPSELDQLLPEVEGITGEAQPFDTGTERLSVDVETLDIPVWLKYLIAQGQDPSYRGKHPSRSEAHGHATEALLKAGIDPETVMRLLLDPRYKISDRPREKGRSWLAGDIARIKAKMNGHRPGTSTTGADENHVSELPDAPQEPHDEIHLTDVGNGLRLVQQFGHDLRYVTTWDKWLAWDQGRWKIDAARSVEWHSKQVIASLYRSAELQLEELNHGGSHVGLSQEDREKKLAAVMATLKWAHTSESHNHIETMVKRARVNPAIQVDHTALDANAMLFQVLNGTVDLNTGTLLDPRRRDLITKQSPVVYNPDAICPLWNSVLQRTQGYPQAHESLDPKVRDERIQRADRMITYLKRLVGMSLTADISEQILLFLHGAGQNGKSTFLNTILALTGEYGMQAAPNFLLVREHEQHPTELTDLFGKRFVSTIEVEKGKQFAEALTKMLTGGENVRARRMREDFWEFPPTWKIWLAANDKPKVKGRDKATWRRIKLIPFEVTIPDNEVDHGLPQKLMKELPGILNWAIEGCLEWKKYGLQEPKEVTEATEAYRAETDLLAQFVKECCTIYKDAKTQSSWLNKAFDTYTGESTSPVEFADIMKAGGYQKKPINGRVYWLGLAINQPSKKNRRQEIGKFLN